MKKMMRFTAGLTSAVMVLSLAACGSTTASSGAQSSSSKAEDTSISSASTAESVQTSSAEGVVSSSSVSGSAVPDNSDAITVRVAGTPDYEPYTYADKNDQVTGYDIEVIKAIDAIAPEIKCTYSYTQWDTLLPGIDADRFDVVANQLGKTDEREQMYLYPKYPYLYAGSSVISSADDPMDDFDDLKGKNIGAIVGSSFTTQMEQYLKEHPDAFTLTYLDGTLPQMLDEIVNGRVDATVNDAASANNKAKIAGISDQLYISDKIFNGGFSYFLFAKNDKGQKIADIFDKYLPVLYYDGTLSKLAQKNLGTDSGVTEMADNGVYKEATLEEFQKAEG